MVSDAGLLQFPTDYPIKVVGRPTETFRIRVQEIILRHVPSLDPARVSERLSKNRNYLSITYVIRAESREQVTTLAAELRACEEVLMLL